jgi:hydroxymethylbilane synthase
MTHPLRIGSRGSELALWQANHIQSLLALNFQGLPTEIKIIETTGDRDQQASLSQIGGQGVFTKEIESALLRGEIDVAVHSLKDLPTTMDARLTLAATPKRANVEDVFLSRDGKTNLLDLPLNSTVATGSLRRKAQLLAVRSDLRITDIRGNVPSRIRKLQASDWGGMILARAGLERLGLLQHVTHTIPVEMITPSVGQGALGLQTRTEDAESTEILLQLNDTDTHAAITAERAALRAMGGGCQVPMGAFATCANGIVDLRMVIAHPEGLSVVRGERSGRAEEAEEIGRSLCATLLDEGGRELLEAIR